MDEEKRSEYKEKAEAILFASGKMMKFDDIARLGRFRNREILQEVLEELKKEYDEKPGSLKIFNDGEIWKLNVSDKHIDTVKNIISETELTKSVTETLAVIAFKYPILQSDVVKIRSNKAYEHLKELQELGYISRQKHGRTNLIKLTDKFFEYFNLPEDKLKEQFKDFDGIANAIEEKEQEIKEMKEKQDEERRKDNVEAYDEEAKVETYGEKLGNLEVVDEPEEKTEKPVEETAEKPVEEKTLNEKPAQEKMPAEKQKPIIKPKVNAEKKETEEDIQERKAEQLAREIEENAEKRARKVFEEEEEGKEDDVSDQMS